MTIPEIERAIEICPKLLRKLVELRANPTADRRASANTLFEALALAMGREAKELDHA